MRNFKVDFTLNTIFDEAEEHFKDRGVSREQIKEIYYYYWVYVREGIRSLEAPKIYVPKFGTFKPSIPKLIRLMKRLRTFGDKNKNSVSVLIDTINRLKLERIKIKRKKK